MCRSVTSIVIVFRVVAVPASQVFFFFFSSRRRHTRFDCDWSSDVCSSDLLGGSATTRTSFKEDGKRLWVTRRLGGTRPGPAIRGGARAASRRPAGGGRLVGDPWIALPGRVRLRRRPPPCRRPRLCRGRPG